MKTITASKARMNLYRLIDETAVTSEPVQITGKSADAVLVSIDDWMAIQETLYLFSIPGMGESIRNGMKTPVKKCLEWSPGFSRDRLKPVLHSSVLEPQSLLHFGPNPFSITGGRS
jgi:antitoxin YefM